MDAETGLIQWLCTYDYLFLTMLASHEGWSVYGDKGFGTGCQGTKLGLAVTSWGNTYMSWNMNSSWCTGCVSWHQRSRHKAPCKQSQPWACCFQGLSSSTRNTRLSHPPQCTNSNPSLVPGNKCIFPLLYALTSLSAHASVDVQRQMYQIPCCPLYNSPTACAPSLWQGLNARCA